MITPNNPTKFNELADRLLYDINEGLRKMVGIAAANDESLIVGDKYGNSKSVPAKKPLKTLSN